jgi:hypothetical protein
MSGLLSISHSRLFSPPFFDKLEKDDFHISLLLLKILQGLLLPEKSSRLRNLA